jgi:hypothetical protein
MKRILSVALLGMAWFLASSGASALPNIVCRDNAAGTQIATWAGEPTYVWCRVQSWDGAPANGTYDLDCESDGTLEVSGGAVNSSNENDFGAFCTYPSASPGKVAKIDFYDSTHTTMLDTAQVVIAVDGGTPALQTRINQAIDGGLKELYSRWVSGGKDGDFGTTSYGPTTAGFNVLPFITKGTKPGKDATERDTIDRTKIYGEVVHTALGYIQSSATIYSIPDSYGWPNNAPGGDIETGQPVTAPPGHSAQKNGQLLYFYNSGYAHPIITLGLIASDPATVAWAGPVAGRSFESIVQDSLDACYGAMYDPNNANRGGWRYNLYAYQGHDGSAVWCALAINEAELNNPNGITVPAWVKSELNLHTTNCATGAGGTAYGYNCGEGDPRLTGNLMQLLAIQDIPYTNARVQGVMGYIASGWPSSFYPGNQIYCGGATCTDLYAAFTLAKGMRGARDSVDPTQRHVVDFFPGTATDWYHDLASHLVTYKNSGGNGEYSWAGLDSTYLGPYANLETGAAVEILQRGLTDLPPVANAGGPYSFLTSQPNKTVTLDGCASFHQDPTKAISSYQWDVDGNGTYDFTRSTCTLSFDGSGWYPDTGLPYSKTITLRVTDNGSPTLSDTDVATMNVQSGNPQVPPVANPGGPVYVGYVNVPVTFDGSRSYDPNDPAGPCGSPLEYRWDVTGDGVPDSAWLTVPTFGYAFSGPTSNRVTLEVKDSCGAVGTSTANVNVSIALIRPVSYHVKNVRIISRRLVNGRWTVVYEITAALTVRNGGNAAASNITLQLLNGPPNWVLIPDATVNINPVVPAGGEIRSDTPANSGSTDQTFVIRVDTGVSSTTTDTFWQITQYDDNGQNPTTYQASWPLAPAP